VRDVLIVLRKELLDAFRDWRMVIVAFGVMPLAVPLVLAGVSSFAVHKQTVKLEGLLATVNERYATAIALNPEAARSRFAPGGTLDNNVRHQIENAAMDGALQGISIAGFSLLGVFVLWRGLRRFVFRRKPKPAPVIPDNTAQIQALQQSMDAIAIEVERISEAQRFSAKLLKEKVRVD